MAASNAGRDDDVRFGSGVCPDPEIEIDRRSLTASLCYWYAARYTEPTRFFCVHRSGPVCHGAHEFGRGTQSRGTIRPNSAAFCQNAPSGL